MYIPKRNENIYPQEICILENIYPQNIYPHIKGFLHACKSLFMIDKIWKQTVVRNRYGNSLTYRSKLWYIQTKNIFQQYKGKSYVKLGWISKILCWVKETSCEKFHDSISMNSLNTFNLWLNNNKKKIRVGIVWGCGGVCVLVGNDWEGLWSNVLSWW